MRLERDEARARLAVHDHGILCTVHTARGVDAIPCVFAVDGEFVGVPVDRVKPKTTARLQRERNLELDPRATLLVQKWDRDNWSQLWWVRASLRWVADPLPARESVLAALLEGRYHQYRGRPFDRVHVFRMIDILGWAARQDDPTPPRHMDEAP